MNPTTRILTQSHCTAMVAVDSIDPIVQRVQALLAHGRRISVARGYVDSDAPNKVVAGLKVDEVRVTRTDSGGGIGVHLKPTREGFGLRAYPGDPATEREAWDRFHLNDRGDLVRVTFTGGLPDDGPHRDDQLVIRRWTPGCGRCEEIVVAFDPGPDRQQIREDMARHLWVADGGDPALWDKLADAAWGLAGYNGSTGSDLKMDGGERRQKFLDAADQVLAVAWREV